jgi:hypothetical protein
MRLAIRLLLRTKRAGVRTVAARDLPWRMLAGSVSAAGADAVQVAAGGLVVETPQLYVAGAAQASVADAP